MSRSTAFESGEDSSSWVTVFERREVEAEDNGRSVNDRMEADLWDIEDSGRVEVSGASSKSSCKLVNGNLLSGWRPSIRYRAPSS